MEVVTVPVLARTFRETLGNQGAPVVEEILENFANSLISVTLETGELVEFSVDLENMMKRTKTSLTDSLKDRGVQYVLKEILPFTPESYDVIWKVNNVKHSVYVDNGKVCSAAFTYKDPSGLVVWYSHNYYGMYRATSVHRIKSIKSNIREECLRVFCPYSPEVRGFHM